jgi:mRNA-degrading endonuclease toxin of MazEF toxin-antitoxin module
MLNTENFFFAKFVLSNMEQRKSPVFVISSDIDTDDEVLVCKCTSQPARSQFDVKVQLKEKTFVRTNKIYLVPRNQLLFKIPQSATPDEYNDIINKLKLAMNLT